MLGHWIQPWPGEAIIGEVVAVSGEDLVCVAKGGLRFTVNMRDVMAGRHRDVPRGKWAHGWGPAGHLRPHKTIKLTFKADEAVTRRDLPVLS